MKPVTLSIAIYTGRQKTMTRKAVIPVFVDCIILRTRGDFERENYFARVNEGVWHNVCTIQGCVDYATGVLR